ncbi:hypothetical protein MRB53_038426 [Persea americana]|nr:hypothetical protein MRB53_038426 [Persea americana]
MQAPSVPECAQAIMRVLCAAAKNDKQAQCHGNICGTQSGVRRTSWQSSSPLCHACHDGCHAITDYRTTTRVRLRSDASSEAVNRLAVTAVQIVVKFWRKRALVTSLATLDCMPERDHPVTPRERFARRVVTWRCGSATFASRRPSPGGLAYPGDQARASSAKLASSVRDFPRRISSRAVGRANIVELQLPAVLRTLDDAVCLSINRQPFVILEVYRSILTSPQIDEGSSLASPREIENLRNDKELREAITSYLISDTARYQPPAIEAEKVTWRYLLEAQESRCRAKASGSDLNPSRFSRRSSSFSLVPKGSLSEEFSIHCPLPVRVWPRAPACSAQSWGAGLRRALLKSRRHPYRCQQLVNTHWICFGSTSTLRSSSKMCLAWILVQRCGGRAEAWHPLSCLTPLFRFPCQSPRRRQHCPAASSPSTFDAAMRLAQVSMRCRVDRAPIDRYTEIALTVLHSIHPDHA